MCTMGVFDCPLLDLPTVTKGRDRYLIPNRLGKYKCKLHDGKVSPNNGIIDLGSMFGQSLSCFSVVMESTRACVTLHWLLCPEDYEYFTQLLESGKEEWTLFRLLEHIKTSALPQYLIEHVNLLMGKLD